MLVCVARNAAREDNETKSEIKSDGCASPFAHPVTLARVFLASHLYFLNFQQFAYKSNVIFWVHMQINIITINNRQRSNATRYMADSIKVALGISNCMLEFLCLVVTRENHCSFVCPNSQCPIARATFELSIYTDSMKVVLVCWRVAYR